MTKTTCKSILFFSGMIVQCYHTMQIITINSYKYSTMLVGIIIVLFGLCTLMDSYKKSELQIIFVIIMFTGIQLIISRDLNFLRLVLMVIAGKGINEKAMRYFLLVIYAISFLGVIGLSLFAGFNSVYQESIWRTQKGVQIRYNLGFDGPIRLMIMWNCLLCTWYIFYSKKNIFLDLLLTIISLYIFWITDCYTGLFGSFLAIGVPYMLRTLSRIKGKIDWRYITKGSVFFVLGLTMLAMVFDISLTRFGSFLNGRTGNLYRYLHAGLYPKLFDYSTPKDAAALDNSYFFCLYKLGIIPTIIIIIAIVKLAGVLAKKRDLYGCGCFVSFAALAYVAQILEVPFLNYFIFLIILNWEEVFSLNNFSAGSERIVCNKKNVEEIT